MVSNSSLSLSETVCSSEGPVQVKEVKYKGRKYGYSIWMEKSKQLKINYLADKAYHTNASERYQLWKKGKEVLICSSAGYTIGDYNEQQGFTIDAGNVLNQNIAHDMDGLVVINNNQLSIYNVENKFWFSEEGKRVDLKKAYDRNRFCAWAKNGNSSVFQTHLLVYDDKITIYPKGNKKIALRKFLIQLKDPRGEEYTTIFYVRRGEYLYEATKRIFDYLKNKKYQIKAMVNLDTGVNDVLTLGTPYETCNNAEVKGRTNILNANNLLIFYK